MVFLQPQFLWGLLLLAVPVLVHLFDFRRVRKIYFSNVSFLQQLTQKKTPRKNLKRYLVLASRMLALLFLVMAFAQPVLPTGDRQLTGGKSLVYMDNSTSLLGPCGEFNCLEEARTRLLETAADRPVDFACNDPYLRKSGLYSDDEWSLHAERIQASYIPPQLDRWLNEYPRQDVFIISDFKPDMVNRLEALVRSDSMRSYFLVPIRPEAPTNIFVDSVFLDQPFAIDADTRQLMIRVANSGRSDRDNVLIRLKQGQRQVASLAVDLAADSQEEVSFDLSTGDTLELRVEVDDRPATFDNTYFLAAPPRS